MSMNPPQKTYLKRCETTRLAVEGKYLWNDWTPISGGEKRLVQLHDYTGKWTTSGGRPLCAGSPTSRAPSEFRETPARAVRP
jgi:hypothetical protein